MTAFSGLYVVNVSGAGSSPHAARLVLPRTVGSDDVNNAILSPDGTIIASVTRSWCGSGIQGHCVAFRPPHT